MSRPKRFADQRDPDYAAYVRTLPCVLTAAFWRRLGRSSPLGEPHRCAPHGYVEAMHVRSRGAGGPDRGNLLPGCPKAHAEQHAIGIESWAAKWGLDPETTAGWIEDLHDGVPVEDCAF